MTKYITKRSKLLNICAKTTGGGWNAATPPKKKPVHGTFGESRLWQLNFKKICSKRPRTLMELGWKTCWKTFAESMRQWGGIQTRIVHNIWKFLMGTFGGIADGSSFARLSAFLFSLLSLHRTIWGQLLVYLAFVTNGVSVIFFLLQSRGSHLGCISDRALLNLSQSFLNTKEEISTKTRI